MGKQKKRKLVPASLHSEISEYASLLRALRATDTLDITSRLTRLDSAPPVRDVDPANEDETGRHASHTSLHANRGDISSIEEKGHSSALGTSRNSRNAWTRWPLLTEDLHVPEWRFEDEVHSLARQALLCNLSTSDQLSASTSSESHNMDFNIPGEDQVEALLPPSSLRILADISSSHLEHILSALASYCPPVDKSTQHRCHPIGWESVLKIVSAAGLVDSNTIWNVKSRLEAIYGLRVDSSDITSDVPELPAMTPLHDLDSTKFFDGSRPRNRRKRGPYKKSGHKASKAPIYPRASSSVGDDT